MVAPARAAVWCDREESKSNIADGQSSNDMELVERLGGIEVIVDTGLLEIDEVDVKDSFLSVG